jgi:N-acetyl-gamma-glutamyl-phosphate reductase
MATSVAILGASGYSGGELVRILIEHPAVSLVALAADRRAGEGIERVHPHLAGADLALVDAGTALGAGADVLISCLPGGALGSLLEAGVPDGVVIDLAGDHRFAAGWAYGLTEFARADLTGAVRVANPGCYPTATLLGLVPFARAGVIGGPIVVDGLSGPTGAGRRAEDRLMFGSLDASVGPYGSVSHRHIPEMEEGLRRFGGLDAQISFTPHLVPTARGVTVTARARVADGLDDGAALQILRDVYGDEPFVTVTEEWPATKSVAASNACQVSARVDARTGWLVVSAAIDNLGKGAAGQAVQNLNNVLGIEETTGLTRWGAWP